jgi:hypothetical protein
VKATEVQTEISDAATTLGLSTADFRQLPDLEAESVYRQALSTFVDSSFEPRWWWEYLREPQAGFRHIGDSCGFRLVPGLVPDQDAPIYFIAEDTAAPFYPVYLTTARVAATVIGECFGFEYYCVPPDYSWLIGENHHDVIFGTGEPIIQAINVHIAALDTSPKECS